MNWKDQLAGEGFTIAMCIIVAVAVVLMKLGGVI